MKELIHFTAEWCQPCKKMAPIIENYLESNPNIKYTKVDVDSNSDLMAEYDVRGVPTFIVKTSNEISNRHTGAATPEKFAKLFD